MGLAVVVDAVVVVLLVVVVVAGVVVVAPAAPGSIVRVKHCQKWVVMPHTLCYS